MELEAKVLVPVGLDSLALYLNLIDIGYGQLETSRWQELDANLSLF